LHRRRADLRLGRRGRNPFEGRADRALSGQRAALDDGGRLGSIASGCDQRLGDPRQRLHAHVEDQGPGEARQRLVVEGRVLLLGVLVPGDEGDGGGIVAVGDRDAGVGWGGDPGRHSGNHFERDARRGQCLCLFAASAEDERITALQPDDELALSGALHQQLIDSLLRDARGAGLLPDVEQFGVGPGSHQNVVRDEAIVDDHVGRDDQLEGPRRDQPRISRTRADQKDDSGRLVHH
jgi:hypothetical protein